jgi:hypothetical protein
MPRLSKDERDRIAARKPVSGWLCFSCGAQTEGTTPRAVPCCKDQLAIRISLLPAREDAACDA